MPGPSEEDLGLTSPETDFLARVWALFEADSTFTSKVRTKVKWDGSAHDLDEPAGCELPRVAIRPMDSREGWESNVQHSVLLSWEVDIRTAGWDKKNAYGLMHHIRSLLVDSANFDALHTDTSVVHETTAGELRLIGDAESGYHSQIVMTVQTKLRVAR